VVVAALHTEPAFPRRRRNLCNRLFQRP